MTVTAELRRWLHIFDAALRRAESRTRGEPDSDSTKRAAGRNSNRESPEATTVPPAGRSMPETITPWHLGP